MSSENLPLGKSSFIWISLWKGPNITAEYRLMSRCIHFPWHTVTIDQIFVFVEEIGQLKYKLEVWKMCSQVNNIKGLRMSEYYAFMPSLVCVFACEFPGVYLAMHAYVF